MTYSRENAPASLPVWARRHSGLVPIKSSPAVSYSVTDEAKIYARRPLMTACARCCRRGYPLPPLNTWLLGHFNLLHVGRRSCRRHWCAASWWHRLIYCYRLPVELVPAPAVDGLLERAAVAQCVETMVCDELQEAPEAADRALVVLSVRKRAHALLTQLNGRLRAVVVRACVWATVAVAAAASGVQMVRVNRCQLAVLCHLARVSPDTPLLLVSHRPCSPLDSLLLANALLVAGVRVPLRVAPLPEHQHSSPVSHHSFFFRFLSRLLAGAGLAPVVVRDLGSTDLTSAAVGVTVADWLSRGQHWLVSTEHRALLATLLTEYGDGRLGDVFVVPVAVSHDQHLVTPTVASFWRHITSALCGWVCGGAGGGGGGGGDVVCLELAEPMRLSELVVSPALRGGSGGGEGGRSGAGGADSTRLCHHLAFASATCAAVHVSHVLAHFLLHCPAIAVARDSSRGNGAGGGYEDGSCEGGDFRLNELSQLAAAVWSELQQRGACLGPPGPNPSPLRWRMAVARAVGELRRRGWIRTGHTPSAAGGTVYVQRVAAAGVGGGAAADRALLLLAEHCVPWLLADAVLVRALCLLAPRVGPALTVLEPGAAVRSLTVSQHALLELATSLCRLLGAGWRSLLAPPCQSLADCLTGAVSALQRADVLATAAPAGTSAFATCASAQPVDDNEEWASRAFARLQRSEEQQQLPYDEDGDDSGDDGAGIGGAAVARDALWSVHVPESSRARLASLHALTGLRIEALCLCVENLPLLLTAAAAEAGGGGGVIERDQFVDHVMVSVSERLAAATLRYTTTAAGCRETLGDAVQTLIDWPVLTQWSYNGVHLICLRDEFDSAQAIEHFIAYVYSFV